MAVKNRENESNSQFFRRSRTILINAIDLVLDRGALVFALLGTMLLVGTSLSYSSVMTFGTAVSIDGLIRIASVCFAALYVVSVLAFRVSDMSGSPFKKKSDTSPALSTRCIAIVLIVFWLPVLLVRFPGNYDPDTIWELLQLYGYFPLSNQHPWFDTLIFGGFWKLGDVLGSHSITLFIFCVVQVSLTAIAFAYSLHYFDTFCPRWLVIACIVFLCGMPFVPMVAQAMMKDSMFAWLFLLHVVMYIEIVRTRGEIFHNIRYLVIYSIIALLCCMTKKSGFYIILIDTAVCIPWIGRGVRVRWLSAALCVVVMFSICWESIALPAMGVEQGSGGEALSVPFQQVGLLLRMHESELDDDDWSTLNGVFINAEKISADYTPLRSDAVKNHWNDSATGEDKLRFFKWYLYQGAMYPKTYIEAFLVQNYPLFVPDTQYNENDVESGLFFIDNKYNENIAPVLASWTTAASEEDIQSKLDTACLGEAGRKLSSNFDSTYLTAVRKVPLLFSKALYAFWIPFLAVVAAVRQRSKWKMVALSPVVLTVLVVATGPVVLPRYMTTSIYLVPAVLAILFSNKDCAPDVGES